MMFDVINISLADVPDAQVMKMLKRAEVTLELELGKEIDYSNCTDAEKEFMSARVVRALSLLTFRFLCIVYGFNFALTEKC